MELPEKTFLSVSELAERWKTDTSHVLEYVVTGSLIPSVFVDEIECKAVDSETDTPGTLVSGEIQFTAPHCILTGEQFTLHGGIFMGDHSTLLDSELEAGETVLFMEPKEFCVQDIRVRRAPSILMYEAEFSTPPPNTEDEGQLQRTQRTLAALALGLAEKFPAYRKGEGPNYSQLANLATDHLRDPQSDRTPHGFSATTVRQTIAEALKACPDLKE